MQKNAKGTNGTKSAKYLLKIFFAVLLTLAVASAAFASSLSVVLDGVKKGTVTTRMTSGGTDLAVDEIISALGFSQAADAQGIAGVCNGQKIEFWNASTVARVSGNIIALASPVDFADGHWWVEQKTATGLFNYFNSQAGIQGALVFTNEAITPVLKKQSAKKVQPVAPAVKTQSAAKKTTEEQQLMDAVNQMLADGTKEQTAAAKQPAQTAPSAAKQPSQDMTEAERLIMELERSSKKQASKAKKSKSAASQSSAQISTQTEIEPAVSSVAMHEPATESNLVKKEFTKKRPLVVIDAGHGAHDPGAIGHNTREKDINLKAAITLGNILKRYGADVLYTRSTDVFLKLQERTAFANKHNADVFISLHCNSLPKQTDSVKGIEIYLMASPRDKDSLRLAIEENKEVSGSANSVADLQKADSKTRLLLKILGDMQQTNKISESTQLIESLDKAIRANRLQMRKVSQAPFFVLRGAGMPAVLIEMGYLSSASDTARLNSAAYREQIALSVAQGVVAYIKTHVKL